MKNIRNWKKRIKKNKDKRSEINKKLYDNWFFWNINIFSKRRKDLIIIRL